MENNGRDSRSNCPHSTKNSTQNDEGGNVDDISVDLTTQSSSRIPFTSLSQVDADLALARTLQDQERAYRLLRVNNESNEYESSGGSGNYDYEEYSNDGDVEELEEVLNYHTDYEEGNFDAREVSTEEHLELGNSELCQEEIDGSLFENDEAFARALQEAEDQDTIARMMAVADLNDYLGTGEGGEEEDTYSQEDAYEDLDPDNMSYEELVALGDFVGTQSRGLSPELLASLPSTKFISEPGGNTSNCDPCVICRLDYEDGDSLATLPCKHCYHADCIKNWLQINKICPICNSNVAL